MGELSLVVQFKLGCASAGKWFSVCTKKSAWAENEWRNL